MVKQYGQLYLDTRHALLETEDAQTAGMMARQLLCHFSGKSPEAILADRDLYASEQVCRDMSRAVRRLLDGEPLAYVLGLTGSYLRYSTATRASFPTAAARAKRLRCTSSCARLTSARAGCACTPKASECSTHCACIACPRPESNTLHAKKLPVWGAFSTFLIILRSFHNRAASC